MDLHSSIEIHFGSKAFNLVAFVFMRYMLAFQFKNPPPHTLKRRSLGAKVSLQGISAIFIFAASRFSVTIDLVLHSAPTEASLASLLVGFSAHKSVLLDGPKAPSKNSPSCCVGIKLGSSNSSKRKRSGVEYEVM